MDAIIESTNKSSKLTLKALLTKLKNSEATIRSHTKALENNITSIEVTHLKKVNQIDRSKWLREGEIQTYCM